MIDVVTKGALFLGVERIPRPFGGLSITPTRIRELIVTTLRKRMEIQHIYRSNWSGVLSQSEFPRILLDDDFYTGFVTRADFLTKHTSNWQLPSFQYYSYLYTNALPGNIKRWVDDNLNCEDLAMNFLVANVTGKAPVKVVPRQKFKCQTEGCQGETILSADTTHMVERSECLNKFAAIYGVVPLKTIEYRADPLLFKERVPDYLKLYSDVGKL